MIDDSDYAISNLSSVLHERLVGRLTRGVALTDDKGEPVEVTIQQPPEGTQWEFVAEEVGENEYRVFAMVPQREGEEYAKDTLLIARAVNAAPRLLAAIGPLEYPDDH